jgi:hypothetical protein
MKKDTRDGSGLTVGVDLGDRWSRYCVLDFMLHAEAACAVIADRWLRRGS